MFIKLLSIFLLIGFILFSQEKNTNTFTVDANYFYGSILLHNKDIAHLITEHPEGFILSYNKKTFGNLRWQQEYNYPDWGFSSVFQNSKNNTLGNNFGVYTHLNFYFFKRNLLRGSVRQKKYLINSRISISSKFVKPI